MNRKRSGLGVEALNGLIYVAGGHSFIGTGGSLNCVQAYDPSVDTWSSIQSMLTRRTMFRLTALDGCLYAVGGFDGSKHLSSVERFDPREGIWWTMPAMSSHRLAFGAAALDQMLYVVGGLDVEALESGERFDTVMDRWRPIGSLTSERFGHELVECEGRLYAIGGQDRNSHLDSVLEYNPVTDVWTSMTAMKLKKDEISAAVLNCPELERAE